MFNKFLYLKLFFICKVSSITRNTSTYLYETITEIITYAPNILSNWIKKPRHRRHNKQYKTSHDGGKFSQNLRAWKNLCGTTNAIVNQEDIVNNIHTCSINHKESAHWQITQNWNWRLKAERKEKLNLTLLTNAIECFMLFIVAKIIKIIVT